MSKTAMSSLVVPIVVPITCLLARFYLENCLHHRLDKILLHMCVVWASVLLIVLITMLITMLITRRPSPGESEALILFWYFQGCTYYCYLLQMLLKTGCRHFMEYGNGMEYRMFTDIGSLWTYKL